MSYRSYGMNQSEIGLGFLIRAKNKGWVKDEPIQKKASASLTPSDNLFIDIIRLAEEMRTRGLLKQAQSLEEALTEYRQAEVEFSEMLLQAHPDGDVTVADASDDLADIETLESQHEKFMTNVRREPLAKTAKLKKKADDESLEYKMIQKAGQDSETIRSSLAETGLLGKNFSFSGQNWGSPKVAELYAKTANIPVNNIATYNRLFQSLWGMSAYNSSNPKEVNQGAVVKYTSQSLNNYNKIKADFGVPAPEADDVAKTYIIHSATLAMMVVQRFAQVYNATWKDFNKYSNLYKNSFDRLNTSVTTGIEGATSEEIAANASKLYAVIQNDGLMIERFVEAVYPDNLDKFKAFKENSLALLQGFIRNVGTESGIDTRSVTFAQIPVIYNEFSKLIEPAKASGPDMLKFVIGNRNNLKALNDLSNKINNQPLPVVLQLLNGISEFEGAKDFNSISARIKSLESQYLQILNDAKKVLGVK
jgi:hypothetical protein